MPRHAAVVAWAIVVFVTVLVGHVAVSDLTGGWDPAVPLVLRAVGVTLALGTGIFRFASYLGKPSSAALIVGTAFTGVGLVEAGRLVTLVLAQSGGGDALLQVAGRAGWAAGTSLPLLLLLGMAALPLHRFARRRDVLGVYLAAVVVVTLLGIVGPWLAVSPGGVDRQLLVVRPDAAWTVAAYLVMFVLLWRRPDVSTGHDGRWLTFALYLAFLDQTLVAPFWDGIGVGAGIVDATLKLCTYLLAGIGVVIDMMLVSRDQDRAVRRARDEAVERSRIESALAQQAARLTKANEELGQYAYLASHDLQEPLRMVTNYLQLIERRYADALDDDGREFIAYAVDGARRMRQLTNDLLMYSRLDRDDAPPAKADAREAFDAAVLNLGMLIEETGADVRRGDLPVVALPSSRMTQVFQNLIGNALKFRRPDVVPRVRAEAVREGRFWRFTVTDNGIGIDEKYADKVFGVFQRLHRRDVFPGSGIGLAMCRKIVERHGGTIGFTSRANEGTAFAFTVPVEPQAELSDGAAADDDLHRRVSTLIQRARELI